MKQQRFEDDFGNAIEPIKLADAESIRLWRNAQISILRQEQPLTKDEQERYFSETVAPLFRQQQPEQILFRFLDHDQFVGYGGLTHIDWEKREAELSFLLNPAVPQHEVKLRPFISLLISVAFFELQLNSVFTEAYLFRDTIISLLEELGLKKEQLLDKQQPSVIQRLYRQ